MPDTMTRVWGGGAATTGELPEGYHWVTIHGKRIPIRTKAKAPASTASVPRGVGAAVPGRALPTPTVPALPRADPLRLSDGQETFRQLKTAYPDLEWSVFSPSPLHPTIRASIPKSERQQAAGFEHQLEAWRTSGAIAGYSGDKRRAGYIEYMVTFHPESVAKSMMYLYLLSKAIGPEHLPKGSQPFVNPATGHKIVPGRFKPGHTTSVADPDPHYTNVALRSYPIDDDAAEEYKKAMSFETEGGKFVLQQSGLTPAEIMDRIAEARKKSLTEPQTKSKYFRDNEYTPERQKVHQQILDELFSKVQSTPKGEEPTLLQTGGFPGAGKSTMMKTDAYKGWKTKYVHLDSDDIKERLAKADGVELTWRAQSYQTEADDVLKDAFRRAVMERKSILFDGTMKSLDKMGRLVDEYHRHGYRVEIAFANLPMEKAMTRAVGRFLQGGRFVDPAYVASHDHRNAETLEALKSKVDAWRVWDTDVGFGEPAKLVGEGHHGKD